MYKYDMHVHSSECSACATSDVRSMVDAYRKAGYAGFVLTNHFLTGNSRIDRRLTWREKIYAYESAYLKARQYAEGLDMDILFGIEHHYGGGKEVLIYGVEPQFYYDNEDMLDIPFAEFCSRLHSAGGFICHAHPFRIRGYMDPTFEADFSVCDGLEVYNACNYPIENETAQAFCKSVGLQPVSGSDVHVANDRVIGRAGMAFASRVENSQQLCRLLRDGQGSLIIDGKIKQL